MGNPEFLNINFRKNQLMDSFSFFNLQIGWEPFLKKCIVDIKPCHKKTLSL